MEETVGHPSAIHPPYRVEIDQVGGDVPCKILRSIYKKKIRYESTLD